MANTPTLQFVACRDEVRDGRAHVYRIGHEHDTDTVRCWCGPRLYVVCDCESGCWKCDGDPYARELTPVEAEAPDAPAVLVIHQ